VNEVNLPNWLDRHAYKATWVTFMLAAILVFKEFFG
jgi:hypothetical protein